MATFRTELESLINQHSIENTSDTPDYILAGYMGNCLDAFNKAVNAREKWYGRETPPSEDTRPGSVTPDTRHKTGCVGRYGGIVECECQGRNEPYDPDRQKLRP